MSKMKLTDKSTGKEYEVEERCAVPVKKKWAGTTALMSTSPDITVRPDRGCPEYVAIEQAGHILSSAKLKSLCNLKSAIEDGIKYLEGKI